MPNLPSTVKTGVVHWRIETDYLPSGATAPITVPARGSIIIEPMKSSINIDAPDAQMTLGLQRRTITLDDNGSFNVSLIADWQGLGWDYKVTPLLTVMGDDGKWVKASGDLAESFAFHLPPDTTVNLDDERPVGRVASTGQFISRGTGLTGQVLQTGNVIQFVLTDGTTSNPVTLPTVMADGTTSTGTTSTMTTTDMAYTGV